jgi:hypothetical protein
MRMLTTSKPWLVRGIIFAAVATILVWEVTSKTFARYLASEAPERALALDARQPTALLNLAEQKIGIDAPTTADSRVQSLSAGDSQVRTMTESALRESPLNARGLRILGQLANKVHDETRAMQFMQMSAQYSMNEFVAQAWLADKNFEKKDYASALHHADILLRKWNQFLNYVLPMLAQIAEDKDGSEDLRKLLAENPPWRAAFFGKLPQGISDARTPLNLLVALKDTPNPPNIDDLRSYLDFLVQRKFYSLAYYAWLQLLPAEQLNNLGLLFNGRFETPPSGIPFDWVITPGTGVTIDRVSVPDFDDGRVLEVAFQQGRVDLGSVAQLVALPAGKYQFQSKFTGEVVGQRGLKWRVTCAGGANIGESSMIAGRTPTWKTIEIQFDVPGRDCPAQYLHLDLDARMSSEQFVSGMVRFGDLRIVHADAANK